MDAHTRITIDSSGLSCLDWEVYPGFCVRSQRPMLR